MTPEFNLSEKINNTARPITDYTHEFDNSFMGCRDFVIDEVKKDVKEFIRLLKKNGFCKCHVIFTKKCSFCLFIDKLAGKQLR